MKNKSNIKILYLHAREIIERLGDNSLDIGFSGFDLLKESEINIQKKINLVINTPMGAQARFDEQAIGKACIQYGVLAVTTLSGANAVIRAIRCKSSNKDVKSLQEYYS